MTPTKAAASPVKTVDKNLDNESKIAPPKQASNFFTKMKEAKKTPVVKEKSVELGILNCWLINILLN